MNPGNALGRGFGRKSGPFSVYWRRIRISLSFLLLFFFMTALQGIAQEHPITYAAREKPLGEVLEELSARYGVKFAYDAALFSRYMVSFSVKNKSFGEVADILGHKYPVRFRIIDGTWIVTLQQETAKEADYTPSVAEKKRYLGYVTDQQTGEPLAYCNVIFPDNSGTITNASGYFFHETLSRELKFHITHLGYERMDTAIAHTGTTPVVIRLKPFSMLVKEVSVVRKEKNMLELGEHSDRVGFNPSQSSSLPRLSNDDLANMLTLIPGVNLLKGIAGGLSIRGSDPSENLILLDGIPLLETGHLFGNLSLLNSGYIRQAFVSRGGFDARFGDRASGLIELTGKTGSRTNPSMEASANLLNGNLMASIPAGSKFSVTGAWRRSFTDQWKNYLFMRLMEDTRLTGIHDPGTNVVPEIRYGDINLKASYHPSPGLEVTFSMLKSEDQQMLDYKAGNNPILYRNEWIREGSLGFSGNATFQSAGWHHSFSAGYNALEHSGEKESGEEYLPDTDIPGNSKGNSKKPKKIKKVNPNRKKYEFDSDSNHISEMRASWKSELKEGIFTHQFGAGYERNYFSYSYRNEISTSKIPVDSLIKSASQDIGHLFIQQVIEPAAFVRLRWGLRTNYSGYTRRFYFQPRFGMEVKPSESAKIYYNAGLYKQFISRIPRIDPNNRIDLIWFLPDPEGNGLLRSSHHIAGFQWEKGGFLLNGELYHKNTAGKQWLRTEYYKKGNENRIRYTPLGAAELNRGLDLFMQYRHSSWDHQIAWTLSRSDERVDSLNQGAYFPALNDHRHTLRLTEIFSLKGWTLSANWLYRSGQSTLMPESDQSTLVMGRLPYFSQLDAGIAKTARFRHLSVTATVSFLNILDRVNVVQVDNLQLSSASGSIPVQSNISTISFTPVFSLKCQVF